jgi:prepilin-type N-terminal cleavage/methylation domain-containing protein
MKTPTHRSSGFTLIEMVIIVAVLAVLAAAITPMVLQQLIDAKISTSKSSAKALYEAMAGQADVKGSYGFLGDMGRVPTTADELLKPPTGAPLYDATRTFRGVGTGWKGPYLAVGATREGFLKDSWGRDYRITPHAQVRSAGPDGVYDNEDDVVYPPEPPQLGSRVVVTVKREDAEAKGATIDPTGYEVRLYYSNNGQQAFLTTAKAPFAFERVHPGLHAVAVVRISSGQMVAQDTIEVPANSTKLVELFFRP